VIRPWLIGESNPYGSDPRAALYPSPSGSAGHRLCCSILGMTAHGYLRAFERRNLVVGAKWSAPAAREAAARILEERGDAPLVLLGAKVCAAFGVAFQPFSIVGGTSLGPTAVPAAVLPHPSGLSRAWNDPRSRHRARETIRDLYAVAGLLAP